MMKVKEGSLLVDIVEQSRTGKELSKLLVKHGLVKKDFDSKIKKLVSQRKSLLDRLK